MHWTWHDHLQASGLVEQNDGVHIYGDDTDFITLWVVVILHINSVGLLLFPPLGPCLGGFLFGSFCLPEVLCPSGLFCHMIGMWSLDRVGGSPRCMGFCAIPTCMLVLGVQCFLLLLLWVRLRSSALFGDNTDSFGS